MVTKRKWGLPFYRRGSPTKETNLKYPITDADRDDYSKRFKHKLPDDDQALRHARIRSEARDLAELMLESCPASRELHLALTKLEEAVFWANAAISRRE